MTDPRTLEAILPGDSPQTSQEKVNKAIHDIKDLKARGADRGKLVDILRGELRASREAAVQSYQRPTDSENQIRSRYIDTHGEAPRVRMRGAMEGGEFVPGLLDDTVICGTWHERIQRWHSNACLVALVRSGARDDLRSRATIARLAPKSVANLQYWMNRAPDAVKRIFNSTSTTGGEFIPDEILIPEVIIHAGLLTSQLASGLFQRDPMTNITAVNPFASTGLTPYAQGEPTTDSPDQYRTSSMTTAERSRTAKRWGVRTVVSADADEDSIVDSRMILVEQISRAMALGEDDILFNGDTTATHGDTGIANWNPRSNWSSSALGSSVDHRRTMMGLRHRCLDIGASATADLSTLTAATILGLRAELAAPHGSEGDLVLFCPEEVLIDLLDLDEVQTVDKFGPLATVLTGQLAKLFGMSVIPSYMLTNDLNASGIYDNSTTTQGQLLICNRSRFRWGVRRDLTVETDKDITRGVHQIVASKRNIFWSLDASSVRNCVYGYNI